MISFLNDYSQGALPEVMDALVRTNRESTPGYGTDDYCAAASEKFRARFGCPNADVHFLPGGTVTNYTCLTAFLRPWEAVIAPDTAHIAVHETGAVEARGHKVCTVPCSDGKLTAGQVRAVCLEHRAWHGHMVEPRLVYISNSTELGTIYTKEELLSLRRVCDELDLYLYLDGARLPSSLTCKGNNLQPEDYPKLFDAFYVGGTKNGLLFGEAVLLINDALKPCFRHMIKQCGGMISKGRLLGVQFCAYLDNDLFLRSAAHANEMAAALRQGIEEKGYRFFSDSPTNQLFPIFPDKLISQLEKQFSFEYQCALEGGTSVIRLVTSWATGKEWVDAFLTALPPAR